jgi:hypothetical protein
MLSSSAASLKRPVSLKCNKDTELAEDAELLREVASVAAEGAVLDPVLSAKESAVTGPKDASESSLKRKAVDPGQPLPRIQCKASKV